MLQWRSKGIVLLELFDIYFDRVTTAANPISFAGYLPTKPAVTVAPSLDPRLANANANGGDEQTQQDEDARIEAMMMANSSAWDQNQQHINADGGFQKRFRPPMTSTAGAFRGGPAVPPPPYYVCFRCGQKGHYINNCPTNNDPNFDKPRVKKSTGIPRSFLKTVASDNTASEQQPLMVTADGSLVVAVSNDQEWQRLSTAAAKKKAFDRISVPAEMVEDGLKCKLCTLLLLDAVSCPQCSALFCDECMRNHWKDMIAKCPSCSKRISADQLLPSEFARKQVEQLILKIQKSATPDSPQMPPPNFAPFPPNPLMPFFPFPPPPFPMFPGMPPPFLPPFAIPPRPISTASQPATNTTEDTTGTKKRTRPRSRSRSRSPNERNPKEYRSRQK